MERAPTVGRTVDPFLPTTTAGASSIGILEVDVQTSSSTAASGSSIVALARGSGSVVLAIVGGESSNFVLQFGDGGEEAGDLFGGREVGVR